MGALRWLHQTMRLPACCCGAASRCCWQSTRWTPNAWKNRRPSTAAWGFARCCLSPLNMELHSESFSIMSSPPSAFLNRWKLSRNWLSKPKKARRGTGPMASSSNTKHRSRSSAARMLAKKLSVVMARRHLEAADVALLVIDATEGVTSSDATIGGYAHESGRSVILVVNKWDLVTSGRTDGKPPADKEIFEEQLRKVLKYLAYAPVVFISAAEGKNIHTVLKLVKEVAAERRKRVSTGQMNRFLEKIDFQRATVPAANKMRIFYMTQAAVAPPTFILFTNRQVKLHFAFQRFLENQIRAAFGFRGSPIWFKVRSRDK